MVCLQKGCQTNKHTAVYFSVDEIWIYFAHNEYMGHKDEYMELLKYQMT